MGGGRAPCCDKTKVRTGPWSPAEDLRLMNFIQTHGHSNWRALPKQAGLLRCGKSCRLRWINYLRPDVKRGNFTAEEENTIIQLHSSIGNKWSKIASCLPGRTDNEIKNVWNTHLKKRAVKKKSEDENMKKSTTTTDPDPDPAAEAEAETETESSPSSSSSSSSSSCCVSKEAVVADFDVDFWEVLDSLDPLEEAASTRGDDAEEVEIGKWLRMLENELGLDAHADADRLSEPQLVMDFSATHHYLGI